MQRKEPLITGEVYHVMSKSIAGYKIFPSQQSYQRMKQLLHFYMFMGNQPSLSHFLRNNAVKKVGFERAMQEFIDTQHPHVQLIAYCLMPTHIHLVLKQLRPGGISQYLSNALNGYTRYFNLKYNRQGPLWMGRFKNVRIETDEQLLHLTRYLHLNPVTAHIVERPEEWLFSSYHEFINSGANQLCEYDELIDMSPESYRAFVEDGIGYQRERAIIKDLALEDPTPTPGVGEGS